MKLYIKQQRKKNEKCEGEIYRSWLWREALVYISEENKENRREVIFETIIRIF